MASCLTASGVVAVKRISAGWGYAGQLSTAWAGRNGVRVGFPAVRDGVIGVVGCMSLWCEYGKESG